MQERGEEQGAGYAGAESWPHAVEGEREALACFREPIGKISPPFFPLTYSLY